eukprot:scaffold3836_cov417-Prasinococcus_capsulatus_cf.AAC.13
MLGPRARFMKPFRSLAGKKLHRAVTGTLHYAQRSTRAAPRRLGGFRRRQRVVLPGAWCPEGGRASWCVG